MNKLNKYLNSFILSLILTTLSFYVIYFNIFEPKFLYILISIFAIIQIYIQIFNFLHLGSLYKNYFEWISLIFSLIIITIIVIGSIWIMKNLYEMIMIL